MIKANLCWLPMTKSVTNCKCITNKRKAKTYQNACASKSRCKKSTI